MQNTIDFNDKSVVFFYIATIIMTVRVSLSHSAIIPYSNIVDNLFVAISLFLFVVKIILQRYNIKMVAGYMIFGFLVIYTCVKVKDYNLMITTLCIFSMQNVDFNRFLKIIFNVQLTFFFMHIILSLLQLLLFPHTVQYVYRDNGAVRFAFGFLHPNSFSIYLFSLILIWIWLNYERVKVSHLVNITLIEILFYIPTNTKTSVSIMFFIILLIYLDKAGAKWMKKVIYLIAKYCIPIFSLFFIYAIKYYYSLGGIPKVVLSQLNNLLTGRVNLGSYAYSLYGFTFFGQKVNYNINIWNPIYQVYGFKFDNIYTMGAVSEGIVYLIIGSFLFYKLAKKGTTKIQIFIIAWALYAITEVQGLNGFNCFPIFMLSMLLFSRRKNSYNGEVVRL